jgi:hypothetical protein
METTNTKKLSCCSFCKVEGHRIDSCIHPRINEIDKGILKCVAISTMFPFVGSKYIAFQLSRLNMTELNVLKYKFQISENGKKLVKTKTGLVNYLTCGYRNMSVNEDSKRRYITPFIVEFYSIYQFDPANPTALPDSDYVTTFADIVDYLFPNNPSYFLDILSWHTQKMNEFYHDEANFRRLQQNIYHKFDILTIVSPIYSTDKNFECPICYQDDVDVSCSAKMTCGHIYCTDCMDNYLESTSNQLIFKPPSCGICRGVIQDIHMKDTDKAYNIHTKYMVNTETTI